MHKTILRNPWFWAIVVLFGAMVAFTVTVFFVEMAEDDDFGSAARTTGPWAGALVGLVIAALTGMYVLATQAMARATTELAEETRKAREESAAPLVVTYFEFLRNWLLHVSVDNIGRGLARNVVVTFEPPIPSRDEAIGKLPVNAENIPALRPGEKFSHFVDVAPSFFSKESANPRLYVGRVVHDDANGNPVDPEEYPLDLSVYEGMSVFEEKGLNDLVKHVERITRILERVTDFSSVKIKTPRDIHREHDEWLRRTEEEQAQQQESGSVEEESPD